MNLSCLTYGQKDSTEQQLIGALLRSDRQTALSILNSEGKQIETLDRFFNELYWSNLPILLYQRICDLGLSGVMEPLILSDGRSLLLAIREKVARATLDYKSMSEQFLKLVEFFDQLIKHVIWLKGTSFSRSIYSQENHRLSLDFDLVVEEAYKDQLLKCFEENGFTPIWHEPGYCHQYGVGPVGSLQSLNLTPTFENENCHNLSLKKVGEPLIDFKLHPLDTGLRMKEQNRFFVEANKITWSGVTFLAPSVIDHLMISLLHFHKHGFCGWGWLYDIHLLATKLSETPGEWKKFVRRCQLEGIQTSACLGLKTARYQLSSPIPEEVVSQLETWQARLLPASIMIRVSTEFVWNCNSLPMLLLNALVMGDGKRKLRVLLLSVVPSRQFVSQYYARGQPLSWYSYVYCLLQHWLLLLLPAGVVRRTYGESVWKD